jgi:hypothetical protein
MENTKPVTNNTLYKLLIAVLVMAVIILGLVALRKQTIQLTPSDDGTLLTGEVRNHWKFKSNK